MKKHVKRQLLRIKVYLIFDAFKRTKYLVKNKVFYSVGNNFFFQPRKIPSEPKLIKFGNNVTVASNVTFITHDIVHQILNNLEIGIWFEYNVGPISIGNNVFIGSNTTILPNVKVGNNVVIGAGSLITKDIPDGSVVAGNPAKIITTFEKYLEKRIEQNKNIINSDNIDEIWTRFENKEV